MTPSIAFAPDVEPFEPKPLIADLLRTRYCIPGSIFLVESVESLPLPRSSRWRALRLLLGDGELCIQALLRPEMHRFVDLATVRLGCYVRLGHFYLHREQVTSETPTSMDKRSMVFLVVHDLETVGWNMALFEPDEPPRDSESDDGEVVVRTRRGDEKAPIQREEDVHSDRPGSPARSHAKQGEPVHQGRKPRPEEKEDFIPDSDVDSDLLGMAEAVVQARDQPAKQDPLPVHNTAVRPTEQESGRPDEDDRAMGPTPEQGKDTIEDNTRQKNPINDQRAVASRSAPSRDPNQPPRQGPPRRQTVGPVALLRDWTHPSIPLKLTPLRSIPYLPYKQNWSINVLVIVVSLSGVGPFRFPPYSRRTARLADPSTSKRVILTVFLDPDEFCPPLGTPVLLVGVKNHLFDGGSLNKYASDRPPNRSVRWWYSDPSQLAWCDVEPLASWWREQSAGPDGGGTATTTVDTTAGDTTAASASTAATTPSEKCVTAGASKTS